MNPEILPIPSYMISGPKSIPNAAPLPSHFTQMRLMEDILHTCPDIYQRVAQLDRFQDSVFWRFIRVAERSDQYEVTMDILTDRYIILYKGRLSSNQVRCLLL